MTINKTKVFFLFPLLLSIYCLPNALAQNKNAVIIRLPGFFVSKNVQLVTISGGKDWSYKIAYLANEGDIIKAGDIAAKVTPENEEKWHDADKNTYQTSITEAQNNIERTKSEILGLIDSISEKDRELQLLATSGALTDSNAEVSYLSAKAVEQARLDFESRKLKLELLKNKHTRRLALLASQEKILSAIKQNQQLDEMSYQKSASSGTKNATMEGIIVYRRDYSGTKYRVGTTTYKGQTLLEIVDSKNMFIEAYIKESQWSSVGKNSPVLVKVIGQKDLELKGVIKNISNIPMRVGDWNQKISPDAALYDIRTFRAQIEILNIPAGVTPNAEVVVEIQAQG